MSVPGVTVRFPPWITAVGSAIRTDTCKGTENMKHIYIYISFICFIYLCTETLIYALCPVSCSLCLCRHCSCLLSTALCCVYVMAVPVWCRRPGAPCCHP